MTVEEFIADLESKRKELKKRDDDLDFANKLIEKLRTENKQLKEEMEEGLNIDIAKELEKKNKLEISFNKPDQKDKWNDTKDLLFDVNKGNIENASVYEYGGEDPEKLKERINELSRQLKEARNQQPIYITQDPVKTADRKPIESLEEVSNNKESDRKYQEPVVTASDRRQDINNIDESLRR